MTSSDLERRDASGPFFLTDLRTIRLFYLTDRTTEFGIVTQSGEGRMACGLAARPHSMMGAARGFPQFLGHMRAHSMRNINQILHGDQR